jgi:Neuraminidase (sialidase)
MMGNRYQSRNISVLNWIWILIPVMLSLLLLSSCDTGGGSSAACRTLVVVWDSDEDLSGAGTDWDIFFSRSTDNGVTWGASQPLNTDVATDGTALDWRPALMTDGEGTWIAAWNYFDDDTDTNIHYARSMNGGATWSAQQALNSNAAQDTGSGPGDKWTGLDIRPLLLPYGADNWTAVWLSKEDLNGAGTNIDIFFSHSTNGGMRAGACHRRSTLMRRRTRMMTVIWIDGFFIHSTCHQGRSGDRSYCTKRECRAVAV